MTKSKWIPKSEVEIGRIKVDEMNDIVVRKVVDDTDITNIDIRIFTTTKNFSGFGKGVYISKDRVKELITLLEKAKADK
jgi:hypothetical protein